MQCASSCSKPCYIILVIPCNCYIMHAHLACSSQATEDDFQDMKHALAVWIDFEEAFDKVWKEDLKLKLHQCGLAGRMYKWIGQYLHNRKAKVQVKQHLRKKRTLRQGCPARLSASPILFLVFIRCPRTYKEPSAQASLRYYEVDSTSPLQTISCNKHSK